MGGTPLPPFTKKFSEKGEKGFWIWGVPPPPFTDKIRKVVFEVEVEVEVEVVLKDGPNK